LFAVPVTASLDLPYIKSIEEGDAGLPGCRFRAAQTVPTGKYVGSMSPGIRGMSSPDEHVRGGASFDREATFRRHPCVRLLFPLTRGSVFVSPNRSCAMIGFAWTLWSWFGSPYPGDSAFAEGYPFRHRRWFRAPLPLYADYRHLGCQMCL